METNPIKKVSKLRKKKSNLDKGVENFEKFMDRVSTHSVIVHFQQPTGWQKFFFFVGLASFSYFVIWATIETLVNIIKFIN